MFNDGGNDMRSKLIFPKNATNKQYANRLCGGKSKNKYLIAKCMSWDDFRL
jgi:hypothetical protein